VRRPEVVEVINGGRDAVRPWGESMKRSALKRPAAVSEAEVGLTSRRGRGEAAAPVELDPHGGVALRRRRFQLECASGGDG
jgi:hypothetical protein